MGSPGHMAISQNAKLREEMQRACNAMGADDDGASEPYPLDSLLDKNKKCRNVAILQKEMHLFSKTHSVA